MELRTDTRDAERMVDELLARPACLARVRPLRVLERPTQKLLVDVRVVRLDLGDQLLDEVFAMPSLVENRHGISVLSGVSRPCSREKEAGACPRTRTIRDQLPSLVATP